MRHSAGGEAGRVRGGETVRRLEQKRKRQVKVEEEEMHSAHHLKGLKNVSGFITPTSNLFCGFLSALVRT